VLLQLVATVAKDRATSPIIPPLIPHLDLGAAETYGSSSKPALATATAERTDAAADRTSQAPVRPSRSLLRALWGTATAPVKLVVSLSGLAVAWQRRAILAAAWLTRVGFIVTLDEVLLPGLFQMHLGVLGHVQVGDVSARWSCSLLA
jgi:hypothetical protein